MFLKVLIFVEFYDIRREFWAKTKTHVIYGQIFTHRLYFRINV